MESAHSVLLAALRISKCLYPSEYANGRFIIIYFQCHGLDSFLHSGVSLISSMRKLFWCPFTRFYLACAMRPLSLLSSINETLHGRPLSIYSLVSINVLKFTHQSLELFSVNEWLRPLLYRVVCCPFLLVYKSPRVLHTLFCVYPNCAFISETPHQMLQLVCNASHFHRGRPCAWA